MVSWVADPASWLRKGQGDLNSTQGTICCLYRASRDFPGLLSFKSNTRGGGVGGGGGVDVMTCLCLSTDPTLWVPIHPLPNFSSSCVKGGVILSVLS